MKSAAVAVMFGNGKKKGKRPKDEATPQAFFDALQREFRFGWDLAAKATNAKCRRYIGPDAPLLRDALTVNWSALTPRKPLWLNPPYSRCREFVEKAAFEAARGATVVVLVPVRSDTRWWHAYVWDAKRHRPWPGVEVRFVAGRLHFSDSKAGAPFPSVVIVFSPFDPTGMKTFPAAKSRR